MISSFRRCTVRPRRRGDRRVDVVEQRRAAAGRSRSRSRVGGESPASVTSSGLAGRPARSRRAAAAPPPRRRRPRASPSRRSTRGAGANVAEVGTALGTAAGMCAALGASPLQMPVWPGASVRGTPGRRRPRPVAGGAFVRVGAGRSAAGGSPSAPSRRGERRPEAASRPAAGRSSRVRIGRSRAMTIARHEDRRRARRTRPGSVTSRAEHVGERVADPAAAAALERRRVDEQRDQAEEGDEGDRAARRARGASPSAARGPLDVDAGPEEEERQQPATGAEPRRDRRRATSR